MDEMVLLAQQFINSYNVSGIPRIEENGRTSWTVMYALTRALQYELRLTALSDSFGPATLAASQSQYPVINAGTQHTNICRIVESGLYCKGYDGGAIDGTYNNRVSTSVAKLKDDMGVAGVYPDGMTPKVFKALLTMDPCGPVMTAAVGKRSKARPAWTGSPGRQSRNQAGRRFGDGGGGSGSGSGSGGYGPADRGEEAGPRGGVRWWRRAERGQAPACP